MKIFRLFLALVTCFSGPLALAAQPELRPGNSQTRINKIVGEVTREACNKNIVFLGENSHGDEVTTDLKARIVVSLVKRCKFKLVAFEASQYEFSHLRLLKAGATPISRSMVATSAGWFWSHAAVAQPMFDFLALGFNGGSVDLVGLDDQIGGRDQPFSNDTLTARVMEGVPITERSGCVAQLKARVSGTIAESAEERKQILDCLSISRAALSGTAWTTILGKDYSSTFDAVIRFIDRDAKDRNLKIVERDRSMADRLREVATACGASCKIIVWTHNVHAARTAEFSPDYSAKGNLASITLANFPGQVFSLGFTASSGEYRESHNKPPRPIPAAPKGLLEELAVRGQDRGDRYLSRKNLIRYGRVPARIFNHQGEYTQDWSIVFDGIVNVYAERAPVEVALD